MATTTIDLVPFPVPTGVLVKMAPGRREAGFRTATEIPLHELSRDTLNALCDEFREAVFAAAFTLRHAAACRHVGGQDKHFDEVMPGSQEALNRR